MGFYNKTATIVAFLCTFLHCIALSAQKAVVPGYQGKRIVLSGNVNFFPSITGYNYKGNANSLSNKGELYGKRNALVMNAHYQLEAGYVLTRKITGLVGYGIGKSGFDTYSEYNWPGNGFGGYASGNVFYNFKYNVVTAGLEFTTRKNWGIAPVGPFWGLKFVRYNAKDAVPRQVETYNLEEGDYEGISVEDCDCSLFAEYEGLGFNTLLLSMGNRTVLKNGFFINVGLTSAPLGIFIDYGEPMRDRLNRLHFFNAQISVGKFL